jgi:hypothetical protein
MAQTTETSAAPTAVPVIPIQPRDSFTCPSWCAKEHDESDLGQWEYGQWTVAHFGNVHRWSTAHGTEMEARLTWTEIVGSTPILADDGWLATDVGPVIELGGDDGSGYMGTHEVVACDVAQWTRVLAAIAAEVQ